MSRYTAEEICRTLDIQFYVLNYWQTEFPALASREPGEQGSEYSKEDFATIRRIRELLYDEGYTVTEAKKKLADELAAEVPNVSGANEPETPDASFPQPAVQAPDRCPPLEPPVAMDDAVPVSPELGALSRRVERLEGGVQDLIARIRGLAAELKPETGLEDE